MGNGVISKWLFYININTLQPKTYENFVWAHEYYHFEFEKDRIKNADDVTFVNNPVLNENERRANLLLQSC
ncbi:ImmA/IrrE family metallo-endopeptidase [Bacillus thuringiensis]|nr:ImmA/IrrE family metallo-endopeptidase [Bacillus thuringiensis]